jgi:hypothetical protein
MTRCARCNAELTAGTVAGVCPVCLIDAALPEQAWQDITGACSGAISVTNTPDPAPRTQAAVYPAVCRRKADVPRAIRKNDSVMRRAQRTRRYRQTPSTHENRTEFLELPAAIHRRIELRWKVIRSSMFC